MARLRDQTNHFNGGTNDVEAREHGLLWRSMNFIRKQVRLRNNKQLFRVPQHIRCTWWISTAAGHLSRGHWRRDGTRVVDNRCTGERTIPLYRVLPQSKRPQNMHWNPIPHTLRLDSLQRFFLEPHFFFKEPLLGVIIPFLKPSV